MGLRLRGNRWVRGDDGGGILRIRWVFFRPSIYPKQARLKPRSAEIGRLDEGIPCSVRRPFRSRTSLRGGGYLGCASSLPSSPAEVERGALLRMGN